MAWVRNAGVTSPYDPVNPQATDPFNIGDYEASIPVPFSAATNWLSGPSKLQNLDFHTIDFSGFSGEGSYPYNSALPSEAPQTVASSGVVTNLGSALRNIFNALFGWFTV